MIHNRDLMRMAREDLQGKWGLAAGTSFVFFIVSMVGGVIPGVTIIIGGALMLGYTIFSIAIVRRTDVRMSLIFDGFSRFGVTLGAYVIMFVFVFLWMLLLIVPGIIAALRYAMTYYIIADNPDIGPYDAIQESKRMMHGHKWKYFCMQCRFIGWGLLCILTLMIGMFWLIPYIQTSIAHFYEDIKPKPHELDPTPVPVAA